MANPIKGAVSFEAAGATWTLCFSIDALIALEDVLDLPLSEILDGIERRVKRMSFARALLWAALREHHGEVGLIQAGELIPDMGGQIPATQLLLTALAAGFPQAEASDESPRPRTRRKPPTPEGTTVGTGNASPDSGSSLT